MRTTESQVPGVLGVQLRSSVFPFSATPKVIACYNHGEGGSEVDTGLGVVGCLNCSSERLFAVVHFLKERHESHHIKGALKQGSEAAE